MKANPSLGTKVCRHCGPDPIPISCFGKNSSKPDGLQDYCRVAQRNHNTNNRLKKSRKRGIDNDSKIRQIVTLNTHFRCEKMQSVISILVCLKRQKEGGFKVRTKGIPATNKNWAPYYQCLDCSDGKELRERIRALL